MRMFLYYAGHTFKNQIKKLFKTWVAVFILICFAFGLLIGIGAAFISDLADGPDSGQEQVSPSPEDVEDELFTDDLPLPDDEASPDPERTANIIELVVGAVALGVFLFSILNGEKSGSSIFMMADVNLLFASPMKPQSVLLFRLMTQMGALIAASLYLIFQIPNLVVNLGLSIVSAVAMMLAWIIILVVGRLFSVLVYTLASTYPRTKKFVRPAVYAVLVILVVGYFLTWKSGGYTSFDAAVHFFNGRISWYIPFWGWIKAFAMCAVSGRIAMMVLYFAIIVLAAFALTYVIWHLRADFYEDALQKSSEAAEKLAAMQSDAKIKGKRKKDRKDSISRDGLNRGWGASVYFWKSMYNRFRFARFGVLTKTTVTYLLEAVGAALLLKLVFDTEDFTVVVLVLGGTAFFRSLGNPLAEDTQQDTFILIPDSTHKKLLYSLLAGTANCALDLLPAYIIAAVLLKADVLFALMAFVLILSVDLYSSAVGAFIDLSLPVSLNKMIRNMVQILFVYFGLVPLAGLIAVGIISGQTARFMVYALLFDLAIAALVFLFTPQFIKNGRK